MHKLRTVAQQSIWGRDSVSEQDDRLATLLRVYLPFLDVVVVAFGIAGYHAGVPSIENTTGPYYAKYWSLLIAITGLSCLVGVAFPHRLWRLELASKSILVSLLVVYIGALGYLAFIENNPRYAALAIIMLAILPLPVWRVFDIARDRQVHKW
jgi:hypothetical protein